MPRIGWEDAHKRLKLYFFLLQFMFPFSFTDLSGRSRRRATWVWLFSYSFAIFHLHCLNSSCLIVCSVLMKKPLCFFFFFFFCESLITAANHAWDLLLYQHAVQRWGWSSTGNNRRCVGLLPETGLRGMVSCNINISPIMLFKTRSKPFPPFSFSASDEIRKMLTWTQEMEPSYRRTCTAPSTQGSEKMLN